jgi:hypothetical protein
MAFSCKGTLQQQTIELHQNASRKTQDRSRQLRGSQGGCQRKDVTARSVNIVRFACNIQVIKLLLDCLVSFFMSRSLSKNCTQVISQSSGFRSVIPSFRYFRQRRIQPVAGRS